MHLTLTSPVQSGGRFFTRNNVRGYCFGFNGQMKDNEVYGEGNAYTALFWEYDPRLGRRWNMDPKSTVGVSDYACFLNNPIKYTDPLGDKVKKDKDDGVTGKEFRQMKRDIRQLRRSSESFNTMYKDMKADKERTFTFRGINSETENNTYLVNGNDVMIDIGIKGIATSTESHHHAIRAVAHEIGHAYRFYNNLVAPLPSMPTSYMRAQYWREDSKAWVTDYVSQKQTEETMASHVSNIVISEVLKSNNSYFNGLDYDKTYANFPTVQSSYDFKGRINLRESAAPASTFSSERSESYYGNTNFNIRKEINRPLPILTLKKY